MYTRFFGLADKPFAITPDPRYLYLSARHAEALAHLLYAIDDAGGFVQLTGEVGTGKTTVVRSLLAQLPEHADVALILNPHCTPSEFLQAICDELHLWVPETARGSVKAQIDILNHFLLDAHSRNRRVVVIVDEAQQLSAEVLEQVRLLTNLETATRKLLQIILVGQPELRDLVNREDLRQLAQRITGRYHLEPLSRVEAVAYVRHRLQVAGATNEIFMPAALSELHRLSQGIPRIINVIADRALLGAFTHDQHRVTASLVRRAAGEVYGHPFAAPWVWRATTAFGLLGTVLLTLGIWQLAHLTPKVAPHAALASNTTLPAPATPAPTPPAPDLGHFLVQHANEAGTDQAFGALMNLWNSSLVVERGRPCEQAQAQGLMCLSQKGTIAQLRQLNHPAILALMDLDGHEHQVVLSALNDAKAHLIAGTSSIDVDLNELNQYWLGDSLILWRPLVKDGKPLVPGMHGADVRWLRNSLARAQGKVESAHPSDIYDAALSRQVEDFQQRHRLNVDGIAGTQTQILLNALSGTADAPTLHLGGD